MPRDITLTFEDGSQHQYKGVPDDVTPDAVAERASKQFSMSPIKIDGGRPQEQAAPQPQPQPEEEPSTLKDYARWALPKVGQMAHAANMTRRAGIEGVASIPGDIANLAAMPVNALLAKSKFKDNQIPDLGTQKYGEQLADQMGIAKPQPDEETAMMVGRNVIGGLAGSALTKLGKAPEMVQKMYGANTPIRSAVGIGAGTLGAEAGRELTKDSDSETAKTLAPIAGGILANSAVQGISGMMNITSQGARAERAANALKQKVPDADLFDNPLTEYEHNLYSGVLPTAAMKYSNPAVAAAETNARLRNKDSFVIRDTENQRVLANGIKSKASADADTLFKQLNRTTSPMREEAYAKAAATGGFDDAVRAKIAALLANPDTRSSSTLPTIIKPIEKTLEREDLAPGDLYSKRKELADALKDVKKNPLSNVELTNAVKNNQLVAKQLKAAIDEGLDTASDGDWMRYINAHREGAKVPNEIQAWQKVAKGFENKPEIAPGVPRIEAHPLRTNINKSTYSGERDLLSEEGRKEATSMVHTMNALERARSQRGATTGSQTMPLMMEVTKQLVPDKLKAITNLLGGVKDYWKGNTLLDDAILNPEKLPALLEEIAKSKDKTFLDALRGNAVRESTFNQGE